jgi:hypothetical protein
MVEYDAIKRLKVEVDFNVFYGLRRAPVIV